MNYIELINNFWRLHRRYSFSANEAMLYFKLLDDLNYLRWENPVVQSNASICSQTGFSEPTLIRVRNVLKQAGLIEYVSGKAKKEKTVYTILEPLPESDYLNNFSSSVSSSVSESFRHPLNINKTKHKQKNTQNADLNNLSQLRVKSDDVRYDPAVEDSLRSFIAAWNDRTNQKTYKALIPSQNELLGFIDLLSRYGTEGPEMLIQAVCESEWMQREPKTLSWAIKPETATKIIDGAFAKDFEKQKNHRNTPSDYQNDPKRYEGGFFNEDRNQNRP